MLLKWFIGAWWSLLGVSTMSVKASVHAKWIVGRVIGTKMFKTAKVRVTRLVLNPFLLKVRVNNTSTSHVKVKLLDPSPVVDVYFQQQCAMLHVVSVCM